MASSSIPSMEVEKEIMSVPNWLELPRDVIANILKRLATLELLTSACQVCPLWWNICKDPHMWRSISITYYDDSREPDKNAMMFCCNAIKRSCGQLESIDVERIPTDNLLAYIADSAGNLRHMRIAMSLMVTDKGFVESAKKLPYLESLDVSFDMKLSKDSFEAVGRCCPLLKTLICNTTHFDDKVLFAIGRTMPGLRHLKMSGEMPPEDELLALLDGCPILETLDLEECFYYSFDNKESLEKMCREKIKDFRPPSQESCCDYDSDCDSKSVFSSLSSFEEFERILSRMSIENWNGEP